MKVPKTIPEQNTELDIKRISIDPEGRSATVVYKKDGRRQETFVPLLPIYSAGTATQKNTIKVFLRQIVAAGLNVNIGDIPDIFN